MVANFLTQLKSIVSKYKGLGLRSEDSGPWRSQLAAPLKNDPRSEPCTEKRRVVTESSEYEQKLQLHKAPHSHRGTFSFQTFANLTFHAPMITV